ncbi:DNA replication/repair protein RecF [Schaalia sp. ZJ1691]|uniref:DNA replication/repair protein RecF n=1 Tax=Schaalia sp. ZJ1691 TaxID=2709404 RepID=UPI0013EDE8F5|nr:DNA replication/repair protein RecF [Schaalia sp. ZJ1691]
MWVSHVAVDDFRSWKHGVVTFDRGSTVLLGPNGQGKTNLVEAIAYLSTFSSHRVSADGALVRVPMSGDEAVPGGAVIRVKLVAGNGREQVIELEIVRGQANRAKINRTQVRPRDVLGLVKTVVFAPEDLSIVRGDPAVRRKFLDDLATQLHPLFASTRSDFDRVARQRAALMKAAQVQVRRGGTPDLSTIDVFDESFARLSAQVTAARCAAVRALAEPARRAYEMIAQSERSLSIALDASVDRMIGVDPDRLDSGDLESVDGQIDRLMAALVSVRDKEIDRGINLVGAHRDDLAVFLGQMPVKGFASHGESWSAVLSLRLGSFEVLSTDEDTPILILDDVFAELDAARRQGLADMAMGADQVIVTAAVDEDVPANVESHVKHVRYDGIRGTFIDELTDPDGQ